MSDSKRFQHDQSAYERPRTPYRCGRAALWGKPCWQGANADGSCGGVADCAPVRRGDRWECRRPLLAGGKCAQGPLPDGRCCHQRKACQPRPSLRRYRARVTALAALVTLALIIAFVSFGGRDQDAILASNAALDPGELSSVHAGFTQETGCAACHANHELSGWDWLKSAFRPNDMSERCTDCHRFDGPAVGPHNMSHEQLVEARKEISDETSSATENVGFSKQLLTLFAPHGAEQIACVACHSEHKGSGHAVGQVEARVCVNCHAQPIHDFATDHPPFAKDYPHRQPGGVYFNHQRHLGEYFVDPKWTKKANRDAQFAQKARSACTSCHDIEGASREVRPKAFEQTCAGCHSHQIKDAQLVLASADGLSSMSSMLLGLHLEDADDDQVEQAQAQWYEAMAEDGVDAVAQPLEEELGLDQSSSALFGDLKPELVRKAAQAWLDEDEVETGDSERVDLRGWFVGENADGSQSIFYRPHGHKDKVVKKWIDDLYAVMVDPDRDDALRERARVARDALLDPETGAGSCGKCHGVNLKPEADSGQKPSWGYPNLAPNLHTRYSHAPHLNLMDASVGCKECHRFNDDADYDAYFTAESQQPALYASNFAAIEKSSCDSCHRESVVQSDCQLCHIYHRSPGFNDRFRQQDHSHDDSAQ